MLLTVLFLLVLANLLTLVVVLTTRKTNNVANATYDRVHDESDYFADKLNELLRSVESLDGLVEDQSFQLLSLTKPQSKGALSLLDEAQDIAKKTFKKTKTSKKTSRR
jgi:hypothetical protein